MAGEGGSGLGILGAIRARADAMLAARQAAAVFLVLAGILAARWYLEGARTLLDLVLFSVFGVLLFVFRSPLAAFVLLLVSVIRTFVALAQTLDTGIAPVADFVVSAVAIVAAIRAVEATLKLIGRFADGGPA